MKSMVSAKLCLGLGLSLLLPSPVEILGLAPQNDPRRSTLGYDTVAVRGTVGESNPLFVYGRLSVRPMLVDSTTAVFVDGVDNRLIRADLVTGNGWERGGRGDGPGEFSGGNPYFTESGGLILTATPDRRGATFNRTGELVETSRYPEPYAFGGRIVQGVLRDGVVISRHVPRPDPSRASQRLPQEIQAHAPSVGLAWTFPLPPIEHVSEPLTAELRSSLSGQWAHIHARHGTVVTVRPRDREVIVLNLDGSVRGRIELAHEPSNIFVDADERIWLGVWTDKAAGTGGYKVFDRDLQFFMDVSGERGVLDAWGDYLLTLSHDRNDLRRLHLLKRRVMQEK